MDQVLFRLPIFGGVPIYGFGMMLVVAFFAAMEMTKFLARRSRIDPEIFSNAALIALAAGVAGARLSHVLENLGDYTRGDLSIAQNLFNAINIRSGGLTYYGGFLLAFPAVLAYGWYKRVPLRLGMDIVAPCLMIGLGFGRIGCFLNGCCYGAPTQSALGVSFPYRSDAYLEQWREGKLQVPPELLRTDGTPASIEEIKSSHMLSDAERTHLLSEANAQHAVPVHPAELYSTITAWLIAAVLIAFFTLKPPPGRVFALMLMIEGVSRFLLETIRAEPVGTLFGHHIFGNLTFSEGLSIPIVLMGIALWFLFSAPAKPSQPAVPAPAMAA